MILTIFRLHRDKNTEQESFGHLRHVPDIMRMIPRYSPSLGCPIELHSVKIKTNLFKMVELYYRGKERVVVERLCWLFGTSLYPYKVKFFHIDKDSSMFDKDILFLQNLSTIHNKLTNNHITFSSPIQYYLNTTSPPWHNNHSHEHLCYLNRKYKDWIDNFAHAHDCWADVAKFVDGFDEAQIQDNVETFFKNFILPTPPIKDPYTINYCAQPLNTRGLIIDSSMCAPFDITPPVELIINHPDKTIYSPNVSHQTIMSLEGISLQYSDVNLEYILSGGAVVQFKENYLVSRYRNHKIHDAENDCHWCITNDVLRILCNEFSDVRLMSDVRATFVMTYGEEVLIELFEYYTNEFLGAIHFDMAMLALCAPRIAAGVDPF